MAATASPPGTSSAPRRSNSRKKYRIFSRRTPTCANHVDRLKSDPNAIEHEAREKLHYAKPGEVIYTLPPDPQTQVTRAAAFRQPIAPHLPAIAT